MTSDDQEAIDRLVQRRLDRERRKHDAEMRSLRERHTAEIERLREQRMGLLDRICRWLAH